MGGKETIHGPKTPSPAFQFAPEWTTTTTTKQNPITTYTHNPRRQTFPTWILLEKARALVDLPPLLLASAAAASAKTNPNDLLCRRYPFLRGRTTATTTADNATALASLPRVEMRPHEEGEGMPAAVAGVLRHVLGLGAVEENEKGEEEGNTTTTTTTTSSNKSSSASAGLNADLWVELMAFLAP